MHTFVTVYTECVCIRLSLYILSVYAYVCHCIYSVCMHTFVTVYTQCVCIRLSLYILSVYTVHIVYAYVSIHIRHCIHTSLYAYVCPRKLGCFPHIGSHVYHASVTYIYGINTWENLMGVLIGLTKLVCTHVSHTCVTTCGTRVYKLDLNPLHYK